MDSEGASGKPWIPKLTLENYLNLEHMDVISPHILRKIITMHGFMSSKVPKEDLIEVVRSIKLMDAQHSTLESDVSSNAVMSLNDVIKDLSLLHWQECCITSIQTISSIYKEIDHKSPESSMVLGLLAGCTGVEDKWCHWGLINSVADDMAQNHGPTDAAQDPHVWPEHTIQNLGPTDAAQDPHVWPEHMIQNLGPTDAAQDPQVRHKRPIQKPARFRD